MAEFDVTLSALTQAATNFAKHTEEFNTQADETYTAVQTLGESWTGDASDTFKENMEQVHRWMGEMVAALQTFTEALHKARETYEEADMQSAKNF